MIELRQVLNTISDDAARDAIAESATLNFFYFTRLFESV